MLTELEQVHDALESHLRRLGDLLDSEQPSPAEVATARWRLSSAISGRNRILDRIVAPGAPALDELRRGDAAVATQLSGHVAHWPLQRMQADWRGYRAATAQLRERIRRQISAEKSTLYPLLRGARAPSAPRIDIAAAH